MINFSKEISSSAGKEVIAKYANVFKTRPEYMPKAEVGNKICSVGDSYNGVHFDKMKVSELLKKAKQPLWKRVLGKFLG